MRTPAGWKTAPLFRSPNNVCNMLIINAYSLCVNGMQWWSFQLSFPAKNARFL